MEQKRSFLLHGSSSKMRAGGDTPDWTPVAAGSPVSGLPPHYGSPGHSTQAPFEASVQPAVQESRSPAIKATDNLSGGASKSPWLLRPTRHQGPVDNRLYPKDSRAGTGRAAIGGSSHSLQLGAASCEDC